jgi:hypothetical protein
MPWLSKWRQQHPEVLDLADKWPILAAMVIHYIHGGSGLQVILTSSSLLSFLSSMPILAHSLSTPEEAMSLLRA